MTEHPDHFTREAPRREAPGIPFVVEVFPEPGSVPRCARRAHVWHALARGVWVPTQCCQCGVRGHRLWQGGA